MTTATIARIHSSPPERPSLCFVSASVGSNHFSRKWRSLLNGRFITPAMTAAPESRMSGTVICHGDSWGWNSRRSLTAAGRSSSLIPSRSSPALAAAASTVSTCARAVSTSARAASTDTVTSSTASWALTTPSLAFSRFLVALSTALSSDSSTSASSASLFELLGGLVELLLGLHDALFGGADAGLGLGHSSLSSGDPVVPDLGDLLGADVGVAVLAEEGQRRPAGSCRTP